MKKSKVIKEIAALLVSVTLVITFTVGCGYDKYNEKNSSSSASKYDLNQDYIEKYSKEVPDNQLITYADNGTVTSRVVNVTPVYDFNEIGIDTKDLIITYYSVYSYSGETAGKRESITYPNYFDEETGRMKDGFCFFLAEYEITNVNASGMGQPGFDDCGGADMFPVDRLAAMYSASGTSYMCSQIAYFQEYGQDDNDYPFTIKLAKGKKRIVHIGYVLMDKNDNPFSKVGFVDGIMYPITESCIKVTFDMSKEVSACMVAK